MSALAHSVAAMCQGKHGFPSRAKAESVAARMRSKFKVVGAYYCPHCRAWHIGRPPSRTKP